MMMENEYAGAKKGNPWVQFGLVAFLLGVVFVFIAPMVLRTQGGRGHDITRATSNAKSLFYLFVEFDQDYGEFPGDGTAILNEGQYSQTDLRGFKGEWSNDYLGQLIAGGYTNSEEIFYSELRGRRYKRPDNVIRPNDEILRAGECGFAYVKNQSTSDNSGRPLLVAPIAGQGVVFDPGPYDGKAVVLRIDGAVKQLLIDRETGKAKVGEGKTLFEGGAGSVWGEAGFDRTNLVFPEPVR